jgi:transmembrane sensor
MTAGPNRLEDPIWTEALDWVLKLNARPEDGDLQRGLSSWLAQGEAQARAYREARKVWRLTGDVVPLHAGPRRVHPLPPGPLPARPKWRSRAALAGGLLAASLALMVGLDGHLSAKPDYATAIGETRQVTLQDGTIVTLGGESALSVGYGPARRQVVLLKGEAFFEVAHDADRPFTVQAEGLTAEDVGTAFDVDIEAKLLQVSVESGSVRVSYAKGALPVAETLGAGDRLSLDRTTGSSTRDVESPTAVAGWRSGRLVVEDVPIERVVQTLRHYHVGYIWVRDPALAERRVSGVYDLGDPVAALKAAVEPHAGLVTQVTPYLLVVSSR